MTVPIVCGTCKKIPGLKAKGRVMGRATPHTYHNALKRMKYIYKKHIEAMSEDKGFQLDTT